jgi:CRP-like cAMP-binding protein
MSDNPPSILQLLQGVFPFSDLDQMVLDQVVTYLDKITFSSDTRIFEQEQEADALYFILVGTVEITRRTKEGKKTLAILKAGDHFGEDSLTGFHRFQTSAQTRNRAIVIRLRRVNFPAVREISPTLDRVFRLFSDSYQLQLKLNLPWHQYTETIYLITRRHRFFLWIRLVPIILITLAAFTGLLSVSFTAKFGSFLWLILAVIVLVLGGLIAFWAVLEWTNDYFILTKDRVLMQRLVIGVFDSRSETPMTAILSTGMDSTFFGRILGFGAVTARAYTGDLRLSQLPNPDLILALLENRRKSLQAEQRREEQSSMKSMLQQRIAPEAVWTAQSVAPQSVQQFVSNYYTGSFSDLVASFFGLRTEKDGAIIFRTHWWILLKKTVMPFCFLLVILITAWLRFIGVFDTNANLIYVGAIVLTLFGWSWWLYQYMDWRNDIYIISGDQLVDINRRPLGSEEKRSAPVKNIQTVEYSRKGIISLLLNFGTVRIQIGNEELTFDNVYKPSNVQIEIFEHLREYNDHVRKLEQKRMVDWISTYDGIRQEGNRGQKEDTKAKKE